MANTSTLVDQLNRPVLNSSNWNTPTVPTNTSVTPTTGGLVIANAIGCTVGSNVVLSTVSNTMTFDSISFELTNVTNPTNAGFDVAVFNAAGTVDVGFTMDHVTLFFVVTGVNQGSVTFNPINHKWLMISTTGANVIWSASQDGATWNTLFTYSTSNPLSGMGCQIRIGTYVDATLTAASSYTLSNLNFGPLAPPNINDWLAGYDIVPANGTTPGDLDVYAGQCFNFLAQPPLLRAVQTAAQSLAISAWDLITLDTILDLNDCTFVSNVFTATQPGWYGITFRVSCNPPAGTVGEIGLQYTIGGTVVGPFLFDETANATSPWAWNAYAEVYLGAGDSVSGYFQHNAAAAFNTQATGSAPYTDSSALEIVWLSE